MSNLDKMKFESPNIAAENVAKIAELFPGVVTEGKVNSRNFGQELTAEATIP